MVYDEREALVLGMTDIERLLKKTGQLALDDSIAEIEDQRHTRIVWMKIIRTKVTVKRDEKLETDLKSEWPAEEKRQLAAGHIDREFLNKPLKKSV